LEFQAAAILILLAKGYIQCSFHLEVLLEGGETGGALDGTKSGKNDTEESNKSLKRTGGNKWFLADFCPKSAGC